jgi:hypothetical protein
LGVGVLFVIKPWGTSNTPEVRPEVVEGLRPEVVEGLSEGLRPEVVESVPDPLGVCEILQSIIERAGTLDIPNEGVFSRLWSKPGVFNPPGTLLDRILSSDLVEPSPFGRPGMVFRDFFDFSSLVHSEVMDKFMAPIIERAGTLDIPNEGVFSRLWSKPGVFNPPGTLRDRILSSDLVEPSPFGRPGMVFRDWDYDYSSLVHSEVMDKFMAPISSQLGVEH